MDAVDLFVVDENIVQYSNELHARGLVVHSEDSGLPMMDGDLLMRLDQLGMLDEPSPGEGVA
jgi:hypothetical protein